MSASSGGGNGSNDHSSGGSFEPPERPRSGRGLALVIVAVVIGALLLPSATRSPLAAGAGATSAGAGSSASTTSTTRPGHHRSTSTTSTTVPLSSIHVLVANATLTNGVAGSVTSFLASKGFGTLTATNALLKVTASEVYTVGGATADVQPVVAALSLPASSIEPAASAAPVASTTGANVVVIVGPDLATRFNPGDDHHRRRRLTAPHPTEDLVMDDVASLGPLAPLLLAPSTTAVLTDFDGTLSPIVADPDEAQALPAAPGVLARLAEHFGVVAVVSGRPVAFLARRLAGAGPAVRLFGVYGLEWMEGRPGPRWPPRPSPGWRRRQRWWPPPGARPHPASGWRARGRRWPSTGAGPPRPAHGRWSSPGTGPTRTGLVLQPGRRALELRPPLSIDKGQVVEQLAAGCTGRLLRRRRRRRPRRLRRPRPVGSSGASTSCAWPWPTRSPRLSSWRPPTSWSTARRRPSPCSIAWPTAAARGATAQT